MPIVGSGSLFLRGQADNKSIAFEMYGNVTGSTISLHTLATLAEMSAPDAMSEFYGYANQAPPETVTTSAVSSVSSGQATFNGSVTVASGGVTSRGFRWMSGNQSVGTLIASGTEKTAGSGIGSFSGAQSGLSAGTGYSYVAWAENEAGRTYAGVRTYFVTTSRYTLTGTSNYSVSVPGGPALSGVRTSTVDAGQTATVNWSDSSCVGSTFTNCRCVNPTQISGAYNNVACYPAGGTQWGFYIQKTMNGNASVTFNGSTSSPSDTETYNDACAKWNVCQNNQYQGICAKAFGWYNSPTCADNGNEILFWLNMNADGAPSNSPFCTVSLSGWSLRCSGEPTNNDYSYGSNMFNVRTGCSFSAGAHTKFGTRRGSPGFRYRGQSFGPYTNPVSDIRLKTNINYL